MILPDKFLVCLDCRAAFHVAGNPPVIALHFLHDHTGHALRYLPATDPALAGCAIYLEYIFHAPQAAFVLAP